MYFYAYQFVQEKASAEDIVDEVFEHLWNNFSTLMQDRSPVPLLYSLVRNRCIDQLRHKEVHSKYEAYVQSTTVEEEDATDEEQIMEDYGRVMALIADLPPRTRSVFEACYVQGRKYREVGEEMGITTNTVKTLISRALAFVRNGVKEHEK